MSSITVSSDDISLSKSPSSTALTSAITFSSIEEESEKREHYESLLRIKQERAREQRELLKYMCNVPRANKYAAERAAAQIGDDRIMKECALSPTFASEARAALGMEIVEDLEVGLASMNPFRKAEFNRNKEIAAKAVASLDEIYSPTQDDFGIRKPSSSWGSVTPATPPSRPTSSLSFHRISSATAMPSTPSRPSSSLSFHRNSLSTSPSARSQASSHLSYGPEDHDLETFVCPRNIQYYANPNSWMRRWGRAPASPQPILTRTQLKKLREAKSFDPDATCDCEAEVMQKILDRDQCEQSRSNVSGKDQSSNANRRQRCSSTRPFERCETANQLLSRRLIGGRKMGEHRLTLSYETQNSLPPAPYSGFITSRNNGKSNRIAKSANM